MAIDWGAILETGGKGLNLTGNYLGAFGEQQALLNVARAYQDYLNGVSSQMSDELTARADKYDKKLQAMANGLEAKMLAQPGQYEQKLQSLLYDAEPQYLQEANTQLPELTQLVKDISAQSAEAQRQNRRQVETELAQQGVRGGQAATLANRATGELNRDLQRDINQTVYNEAANRQNSRLGYTQTKALYPYQALAGAYGNSYNNANNNISNAYANSYTGTNNALSGAYGSSLSGANNALSNAQGRVYGDAYDLAMVNFPRTQNQNNWMTYGGTALNFLGDLGQLGGNVLKGKITGGASASSGVNPYLTAKDMKK